MQFGRWASRRSEAKYPSLWDGLVGAWCPSVTGPSGVKLFDLSGRNNTGTLTDMDATTDWVRSAGRYALDFDGSNDVVAMSSLTRGNLGTSNATLCIWAKLADASVFGALLAKRSNGGIFPQWAIQQGNVSTGGAGVAGRHFGIFWYRGGQINDTANNQCFRTTNDYVDGNWHHIAVRRINGTALEFFIDGKPVAVTAVVNGTTNINADHATDPITLGAATITGGSSANGQLDDARVYGRALSANEIALLASRRGIAFEPRRTINYGSTATPWLYAPRSRQIIGGGLG
jgi:hypothetical protein